MSRNVTNMTQEDFVTMTTMYHEILDHYDFCVEHPEETRFLFNTVMNMVDKTIDEKPF